MIRKITTYQPAQPTDLIEFARHNQVNPKAYDIGQRIAHHFKAVVNNHFT